MIQFILEDSEVKAFLRSLVVAAGCASEPRPVQDEIIAILREQIDAAVLGRLAELLTLEESRVLGELVGSKANPIS